jgi:hypothetical protein
VLPVARELRRAGVPGGTVLAFALVAPLVNPLSLLYGLTLGEPRVILFFALGSLVVSTAVGLAWERWSAPPVPLTEVPDEPLPAPGLRRMAAVALTAGRELVGPVLGYYVIGLLGVALLGALLPFGCLQSSLSHRREPLLSPLLMAAVALPAYVAPMKAMMILGLMFEHGNSVGAAFVLFLLGGGLNLGLIAGVGRLYGLRPTLGWLGLVLGVVLVLGYVFERPLYFSQTEESHTHAFDDFTSPFPFDLTAAQVGKEVLPRVKQKAGAFESVSLICLGFLALLGVVARVWGRRVRVAAAAEPPLPVSKGAVPFWHRPLPRPVLGFLALAGLCLFAGVGAYVYYPPPRAVFEEMTRVRADALTAATGGHREEAVRQIGRWDDLTRKLQVGVVIRTGKLDPQARQVAEDLRERLEQLRDALLQQRLDDARAAVPQVEDSYRVCRRSYLGE